jgi:hypothetical protein
MWLGKAGGQTLLGSSLLVDRYVVFQARVALRDALPDLASLLAAEALAQ